MLGTAVHVAAALDPGDDLHKCPLFWDEKRKKPLYSFMAELQQIEVRPPNTTTAYSTHITSTVSSTATSSTTSTPTTRFLLTAWIQHNKDITL